MRNPILRPNAIPLYAFFSHINAGQLRGEPGENLKVLDCGAGGQLPPLAFFAEHGMDAYGIDISSEQLEKARQYCAGAGIDVDLIDRSFKHCQNRYRAIFV